MIDHRIEAQLLLIEFFSKKERARAGACIYRCSVDGAARVFYSFIQYELFK